MITGKSKYSSFINKEIVLILKGDTSFTLMTDEGSAQTNSLVAFLIAVDDEYYMLNQELNLNYTIMVNKNEVAMISLAPSDGLMDVEFTPNFEESDLN